MKQRRVKFSKMHGLGNDFVVIDMISQNVLFSEKKIKKLSDRRQGIGFDQLLLVEPPYDPDQDFHYRIFNADGQEVEQCGNGARCFAAFVIKKKLTHKKELCVSSKGGTLELSFKSFEHITVKMPPPEFTPSRIPFKAEKIENHYIFRFEHCTVIASVLSVGNPHCVIVVNDTQNVDVEGLGILLSTHERFPKGVNVSFMQVVQRNQVKLRVYERGVGETMACGTAACAAVVVGMQQNMVDDRVQVELLGGILDVHWNRNKNYLQMIGGAHFVFDGMVAV